MLMMFENADVTAYVTDWEKAGKVYLEFLVLQKQIKELEKVKKNCEEILKPINYVVMKDTVIGAEGSESIPGWENRTQCRKRLAIAAMFFRSCVGVLPTR